MANYIKNQTIDRWFSLCIRTRDDWNCTHCDKQFPIGSFALHCSHINGRRHAATRYWPLNAVSHCVYCHKFLGENPLVFAEWARDRLGHYDYNRLIRMKQITVRRRKPEKKALSDHFRTEYRRMIETGARDLQPFPGDEDLVA